MPNVPGSVVTPEAVRLDYVVGGIATRTFAKVLDLVALAGLWAGLVAVVELVGGLLRTSAGTPPVGTQVVERIIEALLAAFIVLFAVPLCELRWNGRTPGKALLGLRAVTDVGETIGFRHAFIRSLVQLIELPTGIGLLTALTNPRNQRLGDLSAGTFVIVDRGQLVAPTLTPTVFHPPAGCAPFVAALDVSRLSSRDFVLIRDYLLRVNELTPAARMTIGGTLVEHLAPLVGHAPGLAMTNELFVNCVASAYQLDYFGGRLPVTTR